VLFGGVSLIPTYSLETRLKNRPSVVMMMTQQRTERMWKIKLVYVFFFISLHDQI